MLGPRHNFPHCHWHHLSFVIVHPVPHHHCQQTYPHSTIITYQSKDFFCIVPMPRFLGKFPHPLPCYARTCCVDRVLLASSLNEVSFVFVHQLDFVFRFVNFYFKNVHSCIYVFVWFSPFSSYYLVTTIIPLIIPSRHLRLCRHRSSDKCVVDCC